MVFGLIDPELDGASSGDSSTNEDWEGKESSGSELSIFVEPPRKFPKFDESIVQEVIRTSSLTKGLCIPTQVTELIFKYVTAILFPGDFAEVRFSANQFPLLNMQECCMRDYNFIPPEHGWLFLNYYWWPVLIYDAGETEIMGRYVGYFGTDWGGLEAFSPENIRSIQKSNSRLENNRLCIGDDVEARMHQVTSCGTAETAFWVPGKVKSLTESHAVVSLDLFPRHMDKDGFMDFHPYVSEATIERMELRTKPVVSQSLCT